MGGGYQGALLARDVYEEKEDLEAQARKKDLWSGLGRTIGTLAALGITGGTAAPWVTAAWAGGLTAAGGAAGSAWAGDIEKGDFFKGERKELRKRLDPWGEENIVGGISAGVTAGIGQKIKMAKDVSTAQSLLGEGATVEELAKVGKEVESGYKGLDYAGSTIGKTKVGQWLVGGVGPEPLTLNPDVEQFYDPQAESLFKSKFTPEQRPETPLGRDIPLTIGQQSVEPGVEQLSQSKLNMIKRVKQYMKDDWAPDHTIDMDVWKMIRRERI